MVYIDLKRTNNFLLKPKRKPGFYAWSVSKPCADSTDGSLCTEGRA